MKSRLVGRALFFVGIAVWSESLGCRSTGIGDPCVPEDEYDPTFEGFDESEASIESKSFQCQTRTCLVNHFRGRVSCPGGQDAEGHASDPCTVPGSGELVAPKRPAPLGNCVPAQCTDRTAEDTVYCSCRCANVDGNTDDGAAYCECPEAFECAEIASSIGNGRDEGLTGRYCIKRGTAYRTTRGCQSGVPGGGVETCVQ